MSTEFEYLEEKNIVLIRTSGSYELEAEMETLKKAASKLREHNCNRCIFDHRETNVIARIMSSFNRPAVYDDLWGDSSVYAALVFRELNEDLEFYETVCRNRCWNVRIFNDYDAAIDWLSESGNFF